MLLFSGTGAGGFFCHSCFAMCITSEKKNCFPSLHYSCTQNPAGSDTSVTSIPLVTDRICPINPQRHNSRKQTHTISALCRNELEQKKIKPSFFLQAKVPHANATGSCDKWDKFHRKPFPCTLLVCCISSWTAGQTKAMSSAGFVGRGSELDQASSSAEKPHRAEP